MNQYAQETCQECQEVQKICLVIQESWLDTKKNFTQPVNYIAVSPIQIFLELQEIATLSCTRFLASQEAENPCAGEPTIDFQVDIRPKSVGSMV